MTTTAISLTSSVETEKRHEWIRCATVPSRYVGTTPNPYQLATFSPFPSKRRVRPRRRALRPSPTSSQPAERTIMFGYVDFQLRRARGLRHRVSWHACRYGWYTPTSYLHPSQNLAKMLFCRDHHASSTLRLSASIPHQSTLCGFLPMVCIDNFS